VHPSLCPKCLQQGRHLSASSENARVDYYRCDKCGHVWAIGKDRSNAPRKDITITSHKAS